LKQYIKLIDFIFETTNISIINIFEPFLWGNCRKCNIINRLTLKGVGRKNFRGRGATKKDRKAAKKTEK